MSQAYQSPNYTGMLADRAATSERVAFIQNTYLHLAAAIGAFVALEAMLFTVVPTAMMEQFLFMTGGWGWLIFLGLFMVVSWVARSWAHSGSSPALQYAGLMLYVAAEAVIFVPMLYVAMNFAGPSVLPASAIITLLIFGGLTASVLITKADFSWLRSALWIGGMAAMGMIVCLVFLPMFGIETSFLALIFAFAMVVLASGYILYDTSNILRHYRTDQHVAAALALFASLALLFWYVLQIMISLSGRD